MPRTRKNREVVALATLVAVLVLLVGILVVSTDRAGGAAPRTAETPAAPSETPPAKQARRVHVELRRVPGKDTAKAETPRAAVDPGAFPEIVADYRAIGFDAYARALSRLGARFFVVRKPAFTLVAEVDPVDYTLVDRPGPVDDLSPRSRDISTEPRLRRLLAQAVVFGDGRYGVIMLLPRSVDRRVVAALGEIGRVAGGEIDSFVCFYRLTDGDLALQVSEVRTKGGRVVAVDRSVRLRGAG